MAKLSGGKKRGPKEDDATSLEIMTSYLVEGARVNPAIFRRVTVVRGGLAQEFVPDEQVSRGIAAAIAKRLNVSRSTVSRTIERWLADPALLQRARLAAIDRTWDAPILSDEITTSTK
jgi:hypothetical protein